jgi:hypothetical protein
LTLLPHKVMIFSSVEQSDDDGNTVRHPVAEGVSSRAFMQPVAAHDNLTDPQAAHADYVVFLPTGSPRLDAFAVIEFEGRRFELVGEALVYRDPHGTLTHIYARLRAVA